jgi:hypothetical protein
MGWTNDIIKIRTISGACLGYALERRAALNVPVRAGCLKYQNTHNRGIHWIWRNHGAAIEQEEMSLR